MNNSRTILARNLAMLMAQRGINKRVLSQIVGITRPSIHGYITGHVEAGIDSLDQLAEKLGLKPYQLLMEKEFNLAEVVGRLQELCDDIQEVSKEIE